MGHKVEIIERKGLRYVLCDDYVTVADNLEADLGMCYNVTAPLDYIPFEKEYGIGQLVRQVVTVGRVIVFGGTGEHHGGSVGRRGDKGQYLYRNRVSKIQIIQAGLPMPSPGIRG